MNVMLKSMLKESERKRTKRNKLYSNAFLVDCQTEHAFQRACEAMFSAGLLKLLDCGLEVFYQGKDGVVCIKWDKNLKEQNK